MMRKTVLVVDDFRGVREMLGAFLTDSGYNPILCEGASEAIRYINEADAIITDFKMPVMNGSEFAEKAKHQKPGIPVLMISGFPGEIPENNLADKIMTKPVPTEVIHAWFSEVIR